MPSNIYEGQVRVFTTDKDDNPYVIKNGKRAGSHYCRISFTDGGETLYLADFSNEAAGLDGQVCKVAYSQKVDDFGDPILYNGKPQWNLDAIKPVAAQRGANAASPQGQASPTPQTYQKGDFDPNLSRRQTAANDATRILAAIITQTSYDTEASTLCWKMWATTIDEWLSGKTIESEAMAKLDATPEKDIGFAAGPDDPDGCPF